MRRIAIDAAAPDAQGLARAAACLRGGGVVAIPTDTLYGLAADPSNPLAVARLLAIKGREVDRGIPVIAADVSQVSRWVGPLSETARVLADQFWPGPLTLLVPAPETATPLVPAGTGRVAIRVPAHAVAQALCRACGHPVTATSANRSGEAATADPDEVARTIGSDLDLLLDAGVVAGGPPSTIVDTTDGQVRLVRAGAVSWEAISQWLRSG